MSKPEDLAFPSQRRLLQDGLTKREWLMANAPAPGYSTIKRELDESARLQGDPAPYISDKRVITEQAKYARIWADAIIKEAARDE